MALGDRPDVVDGDAVDGGMGRAGDALVAVDAGWADDVLLEVLLEVDVVESGRANVDETAGI